MKKLVLILFAGISFAAAHAQGQVQFGVKGGVNFATITNDYDGSSQRTLTNFNAGLFLKIPVVRFFSVQPEVYYSAQGFKYYDYVNVSDHLNYLNIPVLAKFTSPYGFYLETGPQVGLLLSANEKTQGVSLDVKPNYYDADFSWVFGAGYKIPMSPVGIDFRYNAGLTNIYNNATYGNGIDQPAIRNNVFQLGLTVVLWKIPA